MYAENTVKQNAKQILCLFSACDHLKGIFQRPRLILAPAKWSFHSAPAIFSPSEGTDRAKPPLCDQIVSEWAVCMQIHLGVNNGERQCACVYVCVRVHEHMRPRGCVCVRVHFWRTQVHHWVSAHMLFQLMLAGAGKRRLRGWSARVFYCTAAHCFLTTPHWCAADRAWESECENVVSIRCRIDAFKKYTQVTPNRLAV